MSNNPYKRADHWSQRARKEGFPARSVYKLEQIVEREPVLHRGDRIVDLGCTPGSWSRYCALECGPDATLVGIDVNDPPSYPGRFLRGSIEDIPVETVREALGGPADVVLSDMAPPTTGDRMGDHLRQISLAEAALDLATRLLRPGGSFVVKVFDGSDAPAFTQTVQKRFKKVRRMKPDAVRSSSVEFYLVATDFQRADDAP